MLEYTLILRRLDKRFAFMWVIFFLNIVPIHIFYGFVCRHTQYMECDFPSDHICIRIFISTLSAIKGDCKKEFNPQAGNVYNKFSYYYCIVWDFFFEFCWKFTKDCYEYAYRYMVIGITLYIRVLGENTALLDSREEERWVWRFSNQQYTSKGWIASVDLWL